MCGTTDGVVGFDIDLATANDVIFAIHRMHLGRGRIEDFFVFGHENVTCIMYAGIVQVQYTDGRRSELSRWVEGKDIGRAR